MSSLFSEAFSVNVNQRDLVMEGGGDAGHQAPPHHLMDQVKLSCLSLVSQMTNCSIFIFFSDPDTVRSARSSSSAGSRPLPAGESLKRSAPYFVEFTSFAGGLHCQVTPASCQHQESVEVAQCWRNRAQQPRRLDGYCQCWVSWKRLWEQQQQ